MRTRARDMPGTSPPCGAPAPAQTAPARAHCAAAHRFFLFFFASAPAVSTHTRSATRSSAGQRRRMERTRSNFRLSSGQTTTGIQDEEGIRGMADRTPCASSCRRSVQPNACRYTRASGAAARRQLDAVQPHHVGHHDSSPMPTSLMSPSTTIGANAGPGMPPSIGDSKLKAMTRRECKQRYGQARNASALSFKQTRVHQACTAVHTSARPWRWAARGSAPQPRGSEPARNGLPQRSITQRRGAITLAGASCLLVNVEEHVIALVLPLPCALRLVTTGGVADAARQHAKVAGIRQVMLASHQRARTSQTGCSGSPWAQTRRRRSRATATVQASGPQARKLQFKGIDVEEAPAPAARTCRRS